MMDEKNYSISIDGLNQNPQKFIDTWSSLYNYSLKKKYNTHIDSVLENKISFIELFKWKNGTGDVISKSKMKVVEGFYTKIDILKSLKKEFSWELFEDSFQPSKNSSIWKIFLLHLVKPNSFPIYDQHVFRFYSFYSKGEIEEISSNHNVVYSTYKSDYRRWFNDYSKEHRLNPKLMDESFFTFGQMLKKIKDYPIVTNPLSTQP